MHVGDIFVCYFVFWVRIGAGLPNITGEVKPLRGVYKSSYTSNGALNITSAGTYNMAANGSVSDKYNAQVNLDASQSNSIYGNSETVAPLSLATKYIISC